VKRTLLVAFWHLLSPVTKPLAGYLPWWTLLETTGSRTRRTRRTPLAAGRATSEDMWLIAVHGQQSAWVRNLQKTPHVRVQYRGRWRPGTASVHPYDKDRVREFRRYARLGPSLTGIAPLLVRISYDTTYAAAPPAAGITPG
jgi:deazaflavin-dependent oxidoreductase (nitroreductase family)